jgi:cytochrome c peroxidase
MQVIHSTIFQSVMAACLLVPLAACEKKQTTVSVNAPTTAAALGKVIFHDASLSASGVMSCASCHSPDHAHAQPNALSVQFGGVAMDQPGTRAVPSLRYMQKTPPFSFNSEGTPSGGFNHDGSAETLAIQAERPLLAANEMANGTRARVIEKIRLSQYAPAFRKLYGEHSLDHVDTAFMHLSNALQEYQLQANEFHPFNSKYDFYLAGKAELSPAEMRGLRLFNEEKRANCAACHPSGKGDDGSSPLFTDFTYDALGVARNQTIAANADSSRFDLGLCQSGRLGKAAEPTSCGKFKVPTLRNVATRQVFFHNGQIKTLREAVTFYVTRDTHPQSWYPIVQGKVQKFNDLPKPHHKNINVQESPYDRKLGQKPALSDQEIDDVVAFLHTLTDGYSTSQKTK